MKRRKSDLLINLFLLLVVCALYAATSGDDLGNRLARMTMAPVYRGAGDATALLCRLDYDAAALEDILATLAARQTRITFAVSADWAAEHPKTLAELASTHELAVMGNTRKEAAACKKAIEAAGGAPLYYYAPPQKSAGRIAKKLGLTHVHGTADVLCAKGTAQDIAARASNAAAKGSILLTQPTRAFADALPALLSELQTKGLRVAAVGDAMHVT
ncbi:MAG: hypothetical protein PHC80_03530 [Eubacteriales bacterium]|nr:hypothetical protein [Eubacteriales bacterium]